MRTVSNAQLKVFQVENDRFPSVADEPAAIRVLLVEDNPGDAQLIVELLEEVRSHAFSITLAPTLGAGISLLRSSDFEVTIVDLGLPDAFGESAIDRIRDEAPAMPVVVVSGSSDDDLAVRAMESNRVDEFLSKNHVDGRLIARALRYAIGRRRSAMQLSHMANYDPLTGLVNRRLFEERLQRAVVRSGRTGSSVALLFIDLDKFKQVNDTYGHQCGDALLRVVGERLVPLVRESDTVARLGGDEFAILLEGLHEAEDAILVAAKIAEAMKEPIDLGESTTTVGCSIGIAVMPDHASDCRSLVQCADSAMYQAKRSGTPYQCATHGIGERAEELHCDNRALRLALTRGEFRLHYQPIIDLEQNTIIGVEALARWMHPVHGPLQPSAFMDAIERSTLAEEFRTWTLETACRQAANWRSDNVFTGDMMINIGSKELSIPGLTQALAKALRENGLPAGSLVLEISEHICAQKIRANLPVLESLHALGVRISLDDFGMDESGFEILRAFEPDSLKIDRSFTEGVHLSGTDSAVVVSLIALARHMNITAVAEGIESWEQVDALLNYGTTVVQGWLFCPALPARAFQHWIRMRGNRPFVRMAG